MKLFLQIGAGVVAVLVLVLIFATPLGPVPGFFIGGTPAESPTQWPDTSDVHEIRLGVPGTPPRVVIIWVIDYQNELYVVGSAESGWVKMIGTGSPVDMRLAGNTYSLNATAMTEGWEPVLEAYVAKYEPDYPEIVGDFPSIEEAQGQIGVFKLTR